MTVGTGFPTEGTSYAESTTGTDWTATAFTVGGVFYLADDADNFGLLFEIENGGTPVLELFFDSGFLVLKNSAAGVTSGIALSESSWYSIYISKAAGSSTPVFRWTNDGSTFHDDNGDNALGDFTFTQSRISMAAERLGSVTAKGLKCEIATWGLWAETTDSATAQTYVAYSTLAAKTNAKFFTGLSMLAGGSWVDSANSNNETGGSHSAGGQTIPAWLTGFTTDTALGAAWPTPIAQANAPARSAGGTTTVTPTLGGVLPGRLAVAGRAIKPESATATAESGWVQRASATGGTGTTGADVGLTRIAIDTRTLLSGDTSPTFDQANSPNSVVGAIGTYSKDEDCEWDIQVATGDDSSHGTGRSITATLELYPGDMVLAVVASDTDTSTAFTASSFSATGITFGTSTQRLGAGGVTTGNDSGLYWYENTVTAGSGSVTVTFSLTGGPSSCGPVALVRLRQVYITRPLYSRTQTSTNATGTVAVTEDNDTSSASGTETFTGTVAVTEANDTGAAAGWHTISGTAAVTEAADTSTASGAETFTGTVAVTEANDTSSASGAETFTGTSAQTEANDTGSASGWHTISGTSAQTEANDTGAASGTLTITGTVAVTEADDTSTASGWHTISGTVARTEADDTATASGTAGTVSITGTVAVTEADDTGAAAGWHTISGTVAVTEANDTGAATGILSFTGTAAVTEAADTSTASGALSFLATVAVTEANDTGASSGSVVITGTVAATEADDTSTASGSSTYNVTGTVAVTEADDIAAAYEVVVLVLSRLVRTRRAAVIRTARPHVFRTRRPGVD